MSKKPSTISGGGAWGPVPHWPVPRVIKASVKRATKNVQLVLQHCCETSCIAMLRVFPPMFEPVLQQIRSQGFFSWVVKRATSLYNSFCRNAAKQVARFLLSDLPYLNASFLSNGPPQFQAGGAWGLAHHWPIPRVNPEVAAPNFWIGHPLSIYSLNHGAEKPSQRSFKTLP